MKTEEKTKMLITITTTDHDRLKQEAERSDLTIQQVIRRAIKNYLQYVERKTDTPEKIEEEKKRLEITDEEWNKLMDELDNWTPNSTITS